MPIIARPSTSVQRGRGYVHVIIVGRRSYGSADAREGKVRPGLIFMGPAGGAPRGRRVEKVMRQLPGWGTGNVLPSEIELGEIDTRVH